MQRSSCTWGMNNQAWMIAQLPCLHPYCLYDSIIGMVREKQVPVAGWQMTICILNSLSPSCNTTAVVWMVSSSSCVCRTHCMWIFLCFSVKLYQDAEETSRNLKPYLRRHSPFRTTAWVMRSFCCWIREYILSMNTERSHGLLINNPFQFTIDRLAWVSIEWIWRSSKSCSLSDRSDHCFHHYIWLVGYEPCMKRRKCMGSFFNSSKFVFSGVPLWFEGSKLVTEIILTLSINQTKKLHTIHFVTKYII